TAQVTREDESRAAGAPRPPPSAFVFFSLRGSGKEPGRGGLEMSVTDQLLRNNEHYAGSFTKGDLPLPPAKGVAVVACMDARLDLHELLGLDEGDAHVIRNAGGAV